MKTAERLADLAIAGVIVVLMGAPALAADLQIPPLLPHPTKASIAPWEIPVPQRAPARPSVRDTVVPNIPKSERSSETKDSIKEEAVKQTPTPPPVESAAPATQISPTEAPQPSLLERFGPFLKSQLEEIFTGSIRRRQEPVEPDCRPVARSRDTHHGMCEAPHPARQKSARRQAPLVITPSKAR
jgi:hypothetical protein